MVYGLPMANWRALSRCTTLHNNWVIADILYHIEHIWFDKLLNVFIYHICFYITFIKQTTTVHKTLYRYSILIPICPTRWPHLKWITIVIFTAHCNFICLLYRQLGPHAAALSFGTTYGGPIKHVPFVGTLQKRLHRVVIIRISRTMVGRWTIWLFNACRQGGAVSLRGTLQKKRKSMPAEPQ